MKKWLFVIFIGKYRNETAKAHFFRMLHPTAIHHAFANFRKSNFCRSSKQLLLRLVLTNSK